MVVRTAKDWILSHRLENYGYDWKDFQKMSRNKSRLKSKIKSMDDAVIRKNLAKAGILGRGGRFGQTPVKKMVGKKWVKTGKKDWDYTVGQSFNEELMNIMHVGSGKKNSWWNSQKIW